jgi:hypothetical protein
VLKRLLNKLLELLCWHELILKFDSPNGRMYTQCMRCPYESSGMFVGPQHH